MPIWPRENLRSSGHRREEKVRGCALRQVQYAMKSTSLQTEASRLEAVTTSCKQKLPRIVGKSWRCAAQTASAEGLSIPWPPPDKSSQTLRE